MKNRIQQLRKERGISQKELGAAIGVQGSTVSLYESGRRQPSQEILVAIASYFSCSLDYLLGLTDSKDTGALVLRERGIGADLPAEAQKALELYIKFLKEQYRKE